jgi:predicted RecA/RadA family phage recombinase
MNNFKHPGDVLDLVAPAGGVTSGQGVIIGEIFVVAAMDADEDDEFRGQVTGVFELAKVGSQAWAIGDAVYWDAANDRASTSPAVGPKIGVATAAVASGAGDVLGWVRLDAVSQAGSVGAGGGGGVVVEGSPTPTSLLGAGAIALTTDQVKSGILVIDCGGAGRTVTFPDADDLVAAVPGAEVGDVIKLYVVNGSDAAETITLAAGTGGGFDANQTAASRVIPQNTSKLVHARLTNVTAAAEAYVLYA